MQAEVWPANENALSANMAPTQAAQRRPLESMTLSAYAAKIRIRAQPSSRSFDRVQRAALPPDLKRCHSPNNA
jgi:hypothetical protein